MLPAACGFRQRCARQPLGEEKYHGIARALARLCRSVIYCGLCVHVCVYICLLLV